MNESEKRVLEHIDRPRGPVLASPPQAVADWIALAVRYEEAGGVGCPECRDGLPSDAAKRGHDRHPQDCKSALVANFAAYSMRDFLMQPAECWYGLAAAPTDLSGPVQ